MAGLRLRGPSPGQRERPLGPSPAEGPRILPRADYWVREVLPAKSFPFEPLAMQKKFRFVEGYRGNATVRG